MILPLDWVVIGSKPRILLCYVYTGMSIVQGKKRVPAPCSKPSTLHTDKKISHVLESQND